MLSLLAAGAAGLAAIVALWPTMNGWASELYAASHGSALTIASFTIAATILIIGATSLVASLCQPRAGTTSSDQSDRAGEIAADRDAAVAMSSAGYWTLLAPSHVDTDADADADTDVSVDAERESFHP